MNPFVNIWGKPVIGFGTKIAAFVEIGSTVENPTYIGEYCKIEAFAFIPPGTFIGDKVFIGPHACLTNDKYPKAVGDWKSLPILIGDNASIGAGVVIIPGVNIGKGAIIGAGSVVTKDVPSGETWVGNPARGLK